MQKQEDGNDWVVFRKALVTIPRAMADEIVNCTITIEEVMARILNGDYQVMIFNNEIDHNYESIINKILTMPITDMVVTRDDDYIFKATQYLELEGGLYTIELRR